MLYYRCDCCGKEQEIRDTHPTQANPLGGLSVYGLHRDLKRQVPQGADACICKECADAFNKIELDLFGDYHIKLQKALIEKWNKIKALTELDKEDLG